MAIYGRDRVWSFNERALSVPATAPDVASFGASQLSTEGGTFVVRFDERATPFGALGRVPRADAVRGELRFHPHIVGEQTYALDAAGRHVWWPVAPIGRVEVRLEEPRLTFRGTGYHDVNFGERPLEEDFSGWSWARGAIGSREALVTYAARASSGDERRLALRLDAHGASEIEDMTTHNLSTSRWWLDRTALAPRAAAPRIERTLEDGPFYARSLLRAEIDGAPITMMHETLSCERWQKAWVRGLANFRIGRAA